MLLFIVVKVARLRHVHVHNMENVYGANTGEYFYRWGEGWIQGFGTKKEKVDLLEDGRWFVVVEVGLPFKG